MLKFVILATILTSCLSQDLGDDDYIACDKCRIPDDEFPVEGNMVCFEVKRAFKPITMRVKECHKQKCDSQPFCVEGQQKCVWEPRDILVPQCELERKTDSKPIDQISMGELDVMYHIHSPRYYTNSDYPNNTYCVWNVANTGLVSYHIMNQQLQEPKTHNCEGSDCDCPDSVKIKMGRNEHKLCGSTGNYTYQMSSNGLHVKFCSDNKQTAKGINIWATKFSGTQKRETKQAEWQKPDEPSDNSTTELNHATCQYDYMMRVSQPDVPCPDNFTILGMLEYHNHLMSVSEPNDEMCSEMRYSTSMSSMMPQMNKIEMCAVEYLYRTRNCEFAKIVVNSTNKELSGVAHAVITNALKRPKWMNIASPKCIEADD